MDCLDKLQKLKDILMLRTKKVDLRNFEMKIDVDPDGEDIRVHLECMYTFDDYVNFELLEKISLLFGTKLIDLGDVDYDPGCDTCDYGSCSSMTITIREPIL